MTNTNKTLTSSDIKALRLAHIAKMRCNVIGCTNPRCYRPIKTKNGTKSIMVKTCDQHWVDVTGMSREETAKVLARFTDKALCEAAISFLAKNCVRGTGIDQIEMIKCGIIINRYRKSLTKFLVEKGNDGQQARAEYEELSQIRILRYINIQKEIGGLITQADLDTIKDYTAHEVGLVPVGMGRNRYYMMSHPMDEKRAEQLAVGSIDKMRDVELAAAEDDGFGRFWARDPGHVEFGEFIFPARNMAEAPTGPEYQREEDEDAGTVNIMGSTEDWGCDGDNEHVETQETEEGFRIRDNFSVNNDPFNFYAREERKEKMQELFDDMKKARTYDERGEILARARNLWLMKVIYLRQYRMLRAYAETILPTMERNANMAEEIDQFNDWL